MTVTGETDLAELLRSMEPELHDGEFVFVTIAPGALRYEELKPLMLFEEAEGTTLILRRDTADRERLSGTFPCRLITLNVHSSLDAVGFLAAITARLASAGLGVNPVSAYYHDHLFISTERADEALEILRSFSAPAATSQATSG